jgi:DNA-binding LacI/PurR family transcriptional regulator
LRVHGRGVFVNYRPEKLPSQRYRVLLIYHGQDAIMPLFLDKLLNFFCARHAELTLFEISVLDHLSPAERQEKLREYLSNPADLLIADGSYYLPFKEIDKHRSNFRKFVFFNRYESNFELSNSARILYDYHAAGRLSAETLLANGRQRILYIAPDSRERRKFPPYGPEETYHCRMRAGICEV